MKTSDILIMQFPKISAIYYGLFQSGYDYYSIERSPEHIDLLRRYIERGDFSDFFSYAKQRTCEAYPYWPRAAILETASFYLSDDNTTFNDYELFHNRIMSASNISDDECGDSLWNWIADFPKALVSVLLNDKFAEYMRYEKKWVAEQNKTHREELSLIKDCLDICMSQYHSPVQDIRICINPIKCVYSSDYHLVGSSFIFSSGAFQVDSILHEFLHHVVHPVLEQEKALILRQKPVDTRLDNSYYLSGSDAGILNAFEESVVRSLTEKIINGEYPKNLFTYVENLVEKQ